MDWLSALLLGVLGSIVATAIWEKSKERSLNSHIDDKALSLLQLALKLLPDAERQIYEEEWFMFLCDQESALKRLFHAAMFAKAAATISAEVKILVPLVETVSRQTIANKIPSVRFTQSPDLKKMWYRAATILAKLTTGFVRSFYEAAEHISKNLDDLQTLNNAILDKLDHHGVGKKILYALAVGGALFMIEEAVQLLRVIERLLSL